MSRYSYSQVQTFLTCPLKYRYGYVDKLGVDMVDESLALALGSSVHATLERLYNQVMLHIIPNKEEYNLKFKELWNSEIKVFVNQPSCEESEWNQSRWLEYVNTYYDKYYPFDQAKFLKAEMNVSLNLSKDISFSGKIDRVDFHDDVLIINDYKTNKIRDDNEKDLHKEQLTLYALAMKQKYEGKFKTLLWRLIYLHPGNSIERECTDADLQRVHAKYLQLCMTIDDYKVQLAFGEKEVFKPIKWSHCKFCKFQQICPLRKGMYMEDEEIEIQDLSLTTIKKTIDDFAKIRQKYAAMEMEIEGMKRILITYAEHHGLKTIFGNYFAIPIREIITAKVKEWSNDALEEFLKIEWLYNQTHKIDTFAIVRLLKDNKKLRTELKQWVEVKKTVFPYTPKQIKDFEKEDEL